MWINTKMYASKAEQAHLYSCSASTEAPNSKTQQECRSSSIWASDVWRSHMILNASMRFVMASACNCTDTQRLVQGESMWVDKYTPRSFLELLGDEEINREVVRWLKCWDRCVFGDRAGAAPGRAAKGRPAHDSRPEEKILLICGAPGEQLSTMQDAKHLLYRRMLPQISASIHNMAGSRPEMSADPITGLCDATSNAAHIVAEQ